MSYYVYMTLDGRDRLVVQLVSRFGQLSSKHINELIYADRASRTPCDRALKRLVERRYLARIERRTVGGSRGGSGIYVYSLGPNGHTLFKSGRYRPTRNVNYHSLTIADTYISLTRLHRNRRILIHGYSAEPECWCTFGQIEIKPDLYVEVERSAAPGRRVRIFYEIDLGTEGARQIKSKLNAYWEAYNAAASDAWPEHLFERNADGSMAYDRETIDGREVASRRRVFPLVVWVAIDEWRKRELEWIISQGSDGARMLFHVYELSTIDQLLA